MVTFWESEVAIRAIAGDDISVAKYYDFDRTSCSNWSRASHITRCTTGKPHSEFRVLSAMAFYEKVIKVKADVAAYLY